MTKIRKFAAEFAIGLMGALTLFLCCVAAEGDEMTGWIITYCAGMAVTSLVLLVFGLGGNCDE